MPHADLRKELNANQLKLIAIAAMTLDHLIWTLYPGYSTEWFVVLFHITGRLTAPIMWYFIAEGYHYTHDVKKYAARLFLLAAVSHFAYDFCFGISFIPFQTTAFNQTGVVWSLAWGLVLLYIYDKKKLEKLAENYNYHLCLPGYFSIRLELYRNPGHFSYRNKQGKL